MGYGDHGDNPRHPTHPLRPDPRLPGKRSFGSHPADLRPGRRCPHARLCAGKDPGDAHASAPRPAGWPPSPDHHLHRRTRPRAHRSVRPAALPRPTAARRLQDHPRGSPGNLRSPAPRQPSPEIWPNLPRQLRHDDPPHHQPHPRAAFLSAGKRRHLFCRLHRAQLPRRSAPRRRPGRFRRLGRSARPSSRPL